MSSEKQANWRRTGRSWLLLLLLSTASLIACSLREPTREGESKTTERTSTPIRARTPSAALGEPASARTAVPTTTPTNPVSSPQEKSTMDTPTASGLDDPIQQAMVALARAALAQQLGLGPSEIDMVEVVAIDWTDTSLGCPQSDRIYAQAVTPGFRIVLEADGHRYEYHTDVDRHTVLCKMDGISIQLEFPLTPGEIKDGEPWMPVD